MSCYWTWWLCSGKMFCYLDRPWQFSSCIQHWNQYSKIWELFWAMTDNNIHISHHNNNIIPTISQHKKQWHPTTLGSLALWSLTPRSWLRSLRLVDQLCSSHWLDCLAACWLVGSEAQLSGPVQHLLESAAPWWLSSVALWHLSRWTAWLSSICAPWWPSSVAPWLLDGLAQRLLGGLFSCYLAWLVAWGLGTWQWSSS